MGVLGGCQWGCGVVGVGGVDVDGVEAKDGGGELADGGGDVCGGADVVELVGFFERELSGESIWARKPKPRPVPTRRLVANTMLASAARGSVLRCCR